MIQKQIIFITSLCFVFNAISMKTDEWLNERLLTAASDNRIELAKDSLFRGADVNYANGKTALHWAAYRGYTEMIKVLIQAKANLEIEDHGHNTALMIATTRKYPNAVQMLIDASANVNFQGSKGHTPLMMAAYFGYHEIASMLLQAKADVYQTDAESKTALIFAAKESQSKLVQILLYRITFLAPRKKNSIKNWLLVHQRLRSEGKGLPKDMKNLIAQTIWQLLVEGVQKRLVRAGALQARAFLEKEYIIVPRTPYYCLIRALNEKELKSDLSKQIVGKGNGDK